MTRSRFYRLVFVVSFAVIGAVALLKTFASPVQGCPYGTPFCSVALNKPLPACGTNGYDIILVADRSGSMAGQPTQLLDAAYNQLVDGMIPATKSDFAVINFGSTAQASQGFTSNVASIHSAINNDRGRGGTSYENALNAAYDLLQNSDPRPSVPNLVVFATDGDPTTAFGPDITDAYVNDANNVKNYATMLAVGIGSGPNPENLEKISGTNVNTGNPPDVITVNINTIASILASTIKATCPLYATPTPTPAPTPTPGPVGGGGGGGGVASGGGSGGGTTAGTGTGTSSSNSTAGAGASKAGGTAPSGASATQTGNTDKNVPTSSSIGTTATTTPPTPSPFYDGKLYAAGSDADDAKQLPSAKRKSAIEWWIVGSVGVVSIGVASLFVYKGYRLKLPFRGQK